MIEFVVSWFVWLFPLIVFFVLGGFIAARDVRNNHDLFSFLKKNADQICDFTKEMVHGREDLMAEDDNYKTLVKNNQDILDACQKMYDLDRNYLNKRWINPVSEVRYHIARRRILREAM